MVPNHYFHSYANCGKPFLPDLCWEGKFRLNCHWYCWSMSKNLIMFKGVNTRNRNALIAVRHRSIAIQNMFWRRKTWCYFVLYSGLCLLAFCHVTWSMSALVTCHVLIKKMEKVILLKLTLYESMCKVWEKLIFGWAFSLAFPCVIVRSGPALSRCNRCWIGPRASRGFSPLRALHHVSG